MKPVRTWILVADAHRATMFQHTGKSSGLTAVDGMKFEAELPPTRELVSDRPGRTFESVGALRHAMESPSDPHREQKRQFARRLAGVLRECHAANRFDRLVIVAPAVTMGDLRALLADQVKAVVRAEIVADLTKVPLNELAAHLESHEPFMPGSFSREGRAQH